MKSPIKWIIQLVESPFNWIIQMVLPTEGFIMSGIFAGFEIQAV